MTGNTKHYKCKDCGAIVSHVIFHLEKNHLSREEITQYDFDNEDSWNKLLDTYFTETDQQLTSHNKWATYQKVRKI